MTMEAFECTYFLYKTHGGRTWQLY